MPVVVVLFAAATTAAAVVAGLLLRLPQVDLEATRAVGVQLKERPRIRRFLRSRMEPGVVTGLALSAALIATVVAGTLIGVIVYMIRRNTGVVGWDQQIAAWAGDHASAATTRVLDVVTYLGSTVVVVLCTLVVAFYAYRRWHRRAIPLFLLLVVGGQLLISNLIKAGVARTRPAVHPLASFSGASFPSGHTTAAAAAFAGFALVLGRGRSPRVRAALGGAAAGIAVGVGCSRIFLGVHWFSDVLGGLALGWAWYAVCALAFGGRILRFGAPAEIVEGTASAGAAPKAPTSTGKA